MNKGFLKAIVCACAIGLMGLNVQSVQKPKGLVGQLPKEMPELTIENLTIYGQDPAYKDYFIDYAVKNFTKIDLDILKKLVSFFGKDAAEKLAIPQHYDHHSLKSFAFIRDMIERYPQIAQMFVEPAVKDFARYISLVYPIVNGYPEAAKIFANPMVQYLQSLGWDVDAVNGSTVKKLIDTDPQLAHLFVEPALQYFSNALRLGILDVVFQHADANDKKKIQDALLLKFGKPKNLTQFIEWALKDNYPLLAYPKEWVEPKGRPSKTHLFHYIMDLKNFFGLVPLWVAYNENVQQAFIAAYKKEIAERDKGNYVFFHGQCWNSGFYQDIYKQLWNLIHENQVGDDFTFFRFNQQTNIADTRKNSLFMNYALFGNLGNYGNSSAYYFLSDTNCYSQTFTTEDLFKKFSLDLYAKKYQLNLQELQNLYKKTSTFGTIFLISIPSNKISNVHVTIQKGAPASVAINGKETTDTKIIYDALLDNPASIIQQDPGYVSRNADTIEFAMPLTTAYALDPYHGPRIYSFNATDPEKLKAYTQKRDELFAKIKKDIRGDTQKPKQGILGWIRSKL